MNSANSKWLSATFAFLAMLASPARAGTGGLFFDGVNDFVTMGAATNINNLGVTNFTIECWFKRQGNGRRGNTGSGGFFALPLVTKGMAENEAGRTNMNYYFGIGTNNAGQTVLAADFEDFNNGLNHPIFGNAVLGSNVWVHGAVTYDTGTSNWVLYVNGLPDATTNVLGFNGTAITNALQVIPRYDSLQHAALASCLRVGGATNNPDSGFFAGSMDEVRIWNYARSAAEIAANYNVPVTSASGLIARWGLDETSGASIANSVAGGVNGTLTNGVAFTNGYFTPPTVAITNPANNAFISANNITIEATASDADGSVAKVEFYVGNTLLGDDTTIPFSFDWNGIYPGNYALKAVATDNIGMVTTSSVVNITVTPPPGVGGIYFDGLNDFVTFGNTTSIGVSNFTIECWFKQQGAGKRSNTGNGGIFAVPLVTKGMAEAEGGNVDCNWFFGLGTNNSGQVVLAADFEDFNTGLNHPVRGATPVSSNLWQHAAVTYNVASSNWVLYLNGNQDFSTNILGLNGSAITNVLQLFPRYDSIQHAALGASLRTGGATNADSGFFAGTMDEVRVWNYARSAQDIADNYQAQIPSATGLLARWALNDSAGLAATNSGDTTVAGTLSNGPVWVDGYAFTPAPIITNSPTTQSVQCGDNITLTVGASGATPFIYQWYFGATALTGETNATLMLNNNSGANMGNYTATVHNLGGTVTTTPAMLTVSDTVQPIIATCATNMTLAANAICQAVIPDLLPQISASDSCSAVTLSQTPPAGTPVGLGNHLVTITATDASANQATCSATITVVDVTAPMISVCATNQTLAANASCQAIIPDLTGQILAGDSCGAVSISQSPLAGTPVGLGNHLVTITVSDAATNLTTCSATVTVIDVTAPNIAVCATNMTLNADTNCQAMIPDLTGQISASDTCGAVTISQSPLAGTLVGLGNTLVTLTVSDAATNLNTCNATITVIDVTAPMISLCATNMTLSADTNCQAMIPDLTAQISASDTCGAVTISQSPLAGTLVGLGNTLVTLTVSDAATNLATCNATMTVVDGFAPLITTQPLSQTNLVGTSATLTIAATSCSAISQQWLFGTNVLTGETNPTLTLTNVQPVNAGDYTVVLANSAGNTTSIVATLTVLAPAAPVLSAGPMILPNGHFYAGFTGTPNIPYTIKVSPDMTGPWQTLTNLTTDGSGFIGVEDFTTPAPPMRFYRVVYP